MKAQPASPSPSPARPGSSASSIHVDDETHREEEVRYTARMSITDGRDGTSSHFLYTDQFLSDKVAKLYAIECTRPMMECDESGRVPFVEAVKAVLQVLRVKAVTGSRDCVSVVFFGTVGCLPGACISLLNALWCKSTTRRLMMTKNKSLNARNAVLYRRLAIPDVEAIRELSEFAEQPALFTAKYGQPKDSFNLPDLLSAVMAQLSPK